MNPIVCFVFLYANANCVQLLGVIFVQKLNLEKVEPLCSKVQYFPINFL